MANPDYVVAELNLSIDRQTSARFERKEDGYMERHGDYFQSVEECLFQSAEIKRQIAVKCSNSILKAAELIADTFRSSGKTLLYGNGGSAADCQHMAAEFVSRFTKNFDRPALPAVALTTDTSFLTAFSNDCGFEGVFERQVQAKELG